LLAVPIVPAFIGSILLYFLPETPKALILQDKANGVENARKALQSLRNREDVDEELKDLCAEIAESENRHAERVRVRQLVSQREFRWPFITSSVLQGSLQLCGINSVGIF
jgi:hypothetical protein